MAGVVVASNGSRTLPVRKGIDQGRLCRKKKGNKNELNHSARQRHYSASVSTSPNVKVATMMHATYISAATTTPATAATATWAGPSAEPELLDVVLAEAAVVVVDVFLAAVDEAKLVEFAVER